MISSLIFGKDKSDLICSEKDWKYAEFWENYYDPEEAYNFSEIIKIIVKEKKLNN